MDNDLMKNALMKKKMNGLDLTIILGDHEDEDKSANAELAPGEIRDEQEPIEKASSEEGELPNEEDAVEIGMEPAEDGEMDAAADEKIKAIMEGSRKALPLTRKAFSKK